jgi:hypothetical protein
VIPTTAFEIIPGAEDDDLVRTPEDPNFRDIVTIGVASNEIAAGIASAAASGDLSVGMTTTNTLDQTGTSFKPKSADAIDLILLSSSSTDKPIHNHLSPMHTSNFIDTHHVATNSSTSGMPHSGLNGGPILEDDDHKEGLGKQLMHLLSTRRKSTCSWTEEVLYDEAEVRSALPLASPELSEGSKMDSSMGTESKGGVESEAPMTIANVNNAKFKDRIEPDISNRRLVMVALDSAGMFF